MRILAASILLASAIATPAFAQDAAKPFDGFRVELLAGFDHVSGDGDSQSGLAYGVAAGYDANLGSAVLGVEAEAALATTKQCDTYLTATDELCLKAGRDLYVGARAGFVAGESTLVYLKAGYTNARERYTYDDGASGSLNFEDGENLDGVRIGAGVEQAFGDNLVGKIEYRYSNYELGVERHQVLGGLGYRF